MTKPLPIIHLARAEDHERLVRALHALDWRYLGGATPGEAAQMYLDDIVEDGKVKYPYLALDTEGQVTAFRGLEQTWRRRGYTVVNSPAHFLAYTKTLGPAAQVHDTYYDTMEYEFGALDPDGN